MPKEAVFTLKLETELRDRFMAEAEAADRPASQLVREFMRDYVKRQAEARDHDAWFREKVEQGLRELDGPNVELVPNDDVMADLQRRRADLIARLGRRDV